MALHYDANLKQPCPDSGMNKRLMKIVNKMLPAIFTHASSDALAKFDNSTVFIRHIEKSKEKSH